MSDDNRICGECVSDAFLQNLIRSSSERTQECDYCGAAHPTIDLSALADRCDTVIERFYEVSSLSDAVTIHGRTPNGEALDEVLKHLLGGSDSLREDVAGLLAEIWFDRDTMESRYGEDPWFVEATRHPEALSVAWRQMEHRLQHEARLVNPAVVAVLEAVFGSLLHHRTREGKPVIVEVGPGCEWDTFFRARVFQTMQEMQMALSHPERHLGPRLDGRGPAGRMHCAGVAVFYGAEDRDTALCEVRPPVGSHVLVGEFKVIRRLRLLDLYALEAMGPGLGGSLFDPATQEQAARGQFLKTLTRTLAQPVMPELEQRDYLITQAIADFLATHPVLKLDGVVYPSAQRGPQSRSHQHRNVTLFNKASTVVRAACATRPPYEVQLFEYEEATAYFAPQISLREAPSTDTGNLTAEPTNEPSLELNPATLEIHHVRAVEFTSDVRSVFQHRRREPVG